MSAPKVVYVGPFGRGDTNNSVSYPAITLEEFMHFSIAKERWPDIIATYLESRMQGIIPVVSKPKAPKERRTSRMIRALNSLVRTCFYAVNFSTKEAASLLRLHDILKERNITCLIPLPRNLVKS